MLEIIKINKNVKRSIGLDFMDCNVPYSNCFNNLVNYKMNKKYNFLDIVQVILTIILIIFGLFVLYQIILKLFGGSWTTENVVIAILLAVLGIVFTNSIQLARLRSDHNSLSNQFKCLANDFKFHIRNIE